MTGPSDGSFIPKRGAVKSKRSAPTRRVYLFTLVSYILTFATLLAAGGVFIYSKVIENQLDEEVSLLNTEISSFNEADMQEVLDFDKRLIQANERLNNTASLNTLFGFIEAATVDTVQIESLELTRFADASYQIDASILTDSFDSTILQREEYQRGQSLEVIEINSVTPQKQAVGDQEVTPSSAARSVVTFSAVLSAPLDEILYYPNTEVISEAPLTIQQPPLEFGTSSSAVEVDETFPANEEDL